MPLTCVRLPSGMAQKQQARIRRKSGEDRTMRRSPATRAGSGRRAARPIRCALPIVVLALLIGGSASAARAPLFSGYAFDACDAPRIETMQAWLASPYRALGIYIGGENRSCKNLELSPEWAARAQAMGWRLLPIFVGLQAPCVRGGGLATIDPASAQTEGAKAADDAAIAANALGLRGAIYFDMEGYSANNPTCTQAVQTFVSGWVDELHTRGFTAGVYGSAASTIRDLQPLTAASSAPDAVWIANWDGREDVFGDPYVSDAYWAQHARLHQFRGGHHETWGNVTLNVDSNFVDGPAASATGIAVSDSSSVPEAPAIAEAPSAAGTVEAPGGHATVSWPAGAFHQSQVVTLEAAESRSLQSSSGSGYAVRLRVQQTATTVESQAFTAPLTVRFSPQGGRVAPMTSRDGSHWTSVPALVGGRLPTASSAGFERLPDGSFAIQTTAPGYFGLLPDTKPPSRPGGLTGHFTDGVLVLQWIPAADASGPAASYSVTLDGRTVLSGVTRPEAAIQRFHRRGPTVFRVIATDVAGNSGRASRALVVAPTSRPHNLPKILPAWAWRLSNWLSSGKSGARPEAPKALPDWFWRWQAWMTFPFHIRG